MAAGDDKCRDGGKGSWLPAVCPYATQCAQCGFRENTREIEQDEPFSIRHVIVSVAMGTFFVLVPPLLPPLTRRFNYSLSAASAAPAIWTSGCAM